MLSDRLLAYLQARVGYVATKWSVLRIAVFALAGLVVASLVLPARPGDIAKAPYNSSHAKPYVRNVALPLGDPRGFKPSTDRSTFNVAWIGGSETLAVGARTRAFIPGLVTQRIGTAGGKPVSTDIYYLNAIRLADQLSALSTALSAKPDLVVISLNPVWVLNDLAVQQWSYLDGELVRNSLWPPSRWPVVASLVSPGDAGWRALSRLSPSAVGDRFGWGVRLSDRTSELTFLDPVEGAKAPTPTGLAALANRRPVDFYFSHFVPSNKGTSLAAKQLGILEREVASTSSINQSVLREMFEMVRRSGVDAYFYMPPIDHVVYEQPDAQRYLAQVRTRLAAATAGQTDAHIVFDPRGLQDRVPATKYQDIVHVRDGRPEAEVLAGDICALLTAQGKEPACQP